MHQAVVGLVLQVLRQAVLVRQVVRVPVLAQVQAVPLVLLVALVHQVVKVLQVLAVPVVVQVAQVPQAVLRLVVQAQAVLVV